MKYVDAVDVFFLLLEECTVIFAGKLVARLDRMRRPVRPVQVALENGDRVRMFDDPLQDNPPIGAV